MCIRDRPSSFNIFVSLPLSENLSLKKTNPLTHPIMTKYDQWNYYKYAKFRKVPPDRNVS